MKKKFYAYHLIFGPLFLSALFSTSVHAEDSTSATQVQSIENGVGSAANSVAKTSATPYPNIAEQTETANEVTGQALSNKKNTVPANDTSSVGSETNPYEQLVKLAFRGKGINGVNNYKDAAALYCKKSKEGNDANALFALAWMYANGRGLTKDENVAALLFNKAAAQGHATAKKWLVDFKGDAKLASLPTCMLSAPPISLPEPELAFSEDNERELFYVKGPIYDIVRSLAPTYGIETDLAMAFIKIESGFNPKATSPKNAQGLMQLIPATAARFNVKNPYDPKENIKGGLAYLQWLLAYYEGDVRLVAAAYNAGENAVDKYKGVPPYPETRNYVKKIYKLYRKSYHPFRHDLLVGEKSEIIRVSSNP